MADENQKKKGTKIINSKDLLMVSLSNFYNNKGNINRIIPIIAPASSNRVSLRLIDWFVTNFSKKNNVIIRRKERDHFVHFNVYLSYRSQLKAYSKQLFDSFRRRDRITFYYDMGKSIETTIGQLNMFRWILQNSILEYIEENLSEIETDMIKTQKDNQTNRSENMKVKAVQTENGVVFQKRKKRNQLSKNSVKNMNLFSGKRVVKFD
jgi:hypothetical protein